MSPPSPPVNVSPELEARFRGLSVTDLPNGLRLIEARSHRSRRRGLARLDFVPRHVALHIPSTRSVHTFGMRFALDLIWLDEGGMAARIDRDVGPRRMIFCRRARAVVEAVAGTADAFLAAGVGDPDARSDTRRATRAERDAPGDRR